MNFLARLLLSAIAVLLTGYLLDGVEVDGFVVALIVAVVLAILNAIVKPILVILTIPITIVTLGIFLLVINAVIILLADAVVPGFEVDGFWWALLFSIIVSIINYLFSGNDKKRTNNR
ncbi:phage holin family protein [Fulvivirga kasyanovii]|uniref:Phage holin family protein n=1 Tax=Fulvivirga kasyanovii TaxID=396812 RepID=A0ABW9RJV8_9BACT|nr:phage holin family protein [Fulvivirga kasyanovii]MTI24147.1 phage holin family protein [Fulvivirga kasyanovii]